MDFKPIKTKKNYEEIVEQIKLLISEGDLKPGDKLLSEKELADQLKVSRTSVREALSALELMGLIEIKPGGGTFIKQNKGSIIEPLALILLMERDAALELYELRQILEVEAAWLAAQRATGEDLNRINNALLEMKSDLEEQKLGEEADFKFHYAVAEATHNSLLFRLMNTIADTMRQTLRTSRQRLYTLEGMPERLFREHTAIFQAIKAGEPNKARQAMYDHLAGVREYLVRKPL